MSLAGREIRRPIVRLTDPHPCSCTLPARRLATCHGTIPRWRAANCDAHPADRSSAVLRATRHADQRAIDGADADRGRPRGTSRNVPDGRGCGDAESLHTSRIADRRRAHRADRILAGARSPWTPRSRSACGRSSLGRRFDVVHAVEESVFFALPAARLRGIPVIYDLDSWLSDQLRVRRSREESRTPEAAPPNGAHGAASFATRDHRQRIAVGRRARAVSPHARRADRGLPHRRSSSRARPRARDEPSRALRHWKPPSDRLHRQSRVLSGNRASAPRPSRAWHACARDAVLVLVGGSPPQMDAVRARVAALGIDADRVVLAGQRPAEEMPEWMAMGSMLVSPRPHGGNTPLKLFSYMWSADPHRRNGSAYAHAGARCALRHPVRTRARGDGDCNARRARRPCAFRIAGRRSPRARAARLLARRVSPKTPRRLRDSLRRPCARALRRACSRA